MKKVFKKNNTKRNTKKNNTKRNTKKNNTKRNTKKNNTKRNTKKIYKRKMNGGGDGEEEEAEKKIWENLKPEQKLLSNQKVRIQIQFEKKKIEGKATINVTYEDEKFILKITLDRMPSVYDLKSSITYMPSIPHIYIKYNYIISDDDLRILKNGVDKFTGFDEIKFPNYYEEKNCTLPDLSQIILNFDKFTKIDKLKRILIKRILTEEQRKDEERTKNKVRELHMKEGDLAQLVSISQAS